ncbi:MAG: endonuclease III [Treponemataceae bacterium]
MLEKATIDKIFSRLAERNKNPTTELNYKNDFTLLVAVILSAQATDVGVNKATEKLFAVADTPEKMLALGVEGVKKYIATINYYNTKAKHLVQMSEKLISDFNGTVPDTFEGLTSLAGVGRKTANVILNTIFGHETIAVDTHVLRVANRLGLSNGKTPEAVEADLLKLTPKKHRKNAHHLLILFGRYTCKARNPECTTCFLNDLCKYRIEKKI